LKQEDPVWPRGGGYLDLTRLGLLNAPEEICHDCSMGHCSAVWIVDPHRVTKRDSSMLRLSHAVDHARSSDTTPLGIGRTAGIAPSVVYIPLCQATVDCGKTRSAFQSCYSHHCLLTGNGTNPIACHGHVGTPRQHTAHGSRPRGAREGCVAGPACGSSGVIS
jgi:hypothetical protein